MELTANQDRQLEQLARLSPDLYRQTANAIHLAPKSAGRIIGRALGNFDGIPADLAQRVMRLIDRMNRGRIGIAPGKMKLIYRSRSLRIYLRRRKDLDDLSLYVTGKIAKSTRRIAYLGRDWDHISGPRAKWKLDDQAGARITELLEGHRHA